jgi:aspartate/methionine/tyrosine aminotransferase
MIPDPAYPVYALSARAFSSELYRMPLRAENAFLPDLDAIPDDVWRRASILWINHPGNPTGATAPPAFFEKAAALARRYGVLLASDEAYGDVYYEEPPRCALEFGKENTLVLHSLSKRSGMAGYRSGFMAGDPRLIADLAKIRPAMGVATPDFIQAAAEAAWSDDDHAAVLRETFRERRDMVMTELRRAGFDFPAPGAGYFLWIPVPRGETSESFSGRCLEQGVVVLPGSALGPAGEGYVRASLTAPTDQLKEALARLARLSV